MIQRTILFTEYWFVPGVDGTDHLEGNQWLIDKVIGEGVVHFHNKKFGVLRLMFIGDMSTTKKANVLFQVEQECDLKFINQKEVNYMADYEKNLRMMFGEKLAIK
jgi:hypothetical protein